MQQQPDETAVEATRSETDKNPGCVFCGSRKSSATEDDPGTLFDCEQCGRYAIAERPPWTTAECRLISVYLQYERQRKQAKIPEITKENWRLLVRFGEAILARADIPPDP